MMKLDLHGLGYYLDIISDRHSQEMRITIQHGQRGIASADLSSNQIRLLKEHIDALLTPRVEPMP